MNRIIQVFALLLVLASAVLPDTAKPSFAAQDGGTAAGARLFETACTVCHDVGGITENPGVYTEAAFRELVRTMVDYGAVLDETETEILIDYLVTSYGKK